MVTNVSNASGVTASEIFLAHAYNSSFCFFSLSPHHSKAPVFYCEFGPRKKTRKINVMEVSKKVLTYA